MLVLLAAMILAQTSCGSYRAASAPTAGASMATTLADTAKPKQPTAAPLPPPTYARWAIDAAPPGVRTTRLFVVFSDAPAHFSITDRAGNVVLRVPVAGSGVFGPETCALRARGSNEVFTYAPVEDATLAAIATDPAAYAAIAETYDGRVIPVPLSDSGCRAP